VRLAGRYLAVGVLTIGLASLHLRHRPPTVCVFRAVTGVPCPFCGGTTAAVDLGHGDLSGALRASPLALGVLAFLPLAGRLPSPRWWLNRRVRWLAIAVVLAVAEVWQLSRFGLIHF
jgi:hypothetical protein